MDSLLSVCDGPIANMTTGFIIHVHAFHELNRNHGKRREFIMGHKLWNHLGHVSETGVTVFENMWSIHLTLIAVYFTSQIKPSDFATIQIHLDSEGSNFVSFPGSRIHAIECAGEHV